MTGIPTGLVDLLHLAIREVDDPGLAADLGSLAEGIYQRAYQYRLRDRTGEDNRPEHELVVLRNTLRVCWRSGAERDSGQPFSRSEFRVATATALLHDLRFIPRITEQLIRATEEQGRHAEADRLRSQKADQRAWHMRGSAEDAGHLLQASPGLLTEMETRQCIGYIGLHDLWKLGWPYPLSSDWLAVCCLEGDALWPLDPDFGPLADLQRRGIVSPTREELVEQAASNLDVQLRAYRRNFESSAERFQDEDTIIRTAEGARILTESRQFWGI